MGIGILGVGNGFLKGVANGIASAPASQTTTTTDDAAATSTPGTSDPSDSTASPESTTTTTTAAPPAVASNDNRVQSSPRLGELYASNQTAPITSESWVNTARSSASPDTGDPEMRQANAQIIAKAAYDMVNLAHHQRQSVIDLINVPE